MKVQQINIDRVIPYARNPRKNEAAVAKVAASIAEFGWRQPIVVDKQMVVVAGHTRLEAAKRLNFDKVPVHVAEGLTPAQAHAYRLMDNRSAQEAEWDEELLALELQDLKLDDLELELTGFDLDEIDRLLAGVLDEAEGNIDDDEVPDLADDPITKPGDLWVLGDHRLLCGDATVLTDVERVLDGGLADLTFCDPPYNVDYGNRAKDKMRGKNRRIMNDNLGEGFYRLLYNACVNILTVTKGAAYICMSSSELHTLQKAFVEAGGHWSTFVIWAKNTFTLGRADYQRQYEPILYGWKEGTDHFWCGARDQGDVWFVDKPRKNDLHPTMKPVALVERAVRNSSKSRDTVLDPFGGSGTTLIACAKTGRQARLLEMDPRYVDVIVRRWQEFTGKDVVLDGDGKIFSELIAERTATAA